MAATEKETWGLALVGCGTVGGGTAQLILQDRERLLGRTGISLELLHIVEKNPAHAQRLGLPLDLVHEDLDRALEDPRVRIVIELVGGTGFAKTLMEKALRAGKHVVTANKALLAKHGRELFALARAHDAAIGFEASCGGGIPVIRALYDGLMANRISALFGIVNGTCNFILSEMIQKRKAYGEALADAQSAGFAEADPTLDVEGVDASHKLAILGSLAFGRWIDVDKVHTRGISKLSDFDVACGQRLGYVVKLIAQAVQGPDGIHARVEPAFIAQNHPLAWVNGSFNALSVYGNAVGHTLYYGRGAGASPTASAVVSDILSLAGGTYLPAFRQLRIWPDQTEAAKVLGPDEIERRYYVRMMVKDQPGNLGDITRIVGTYGISVQSIHQDEGSDQAGMVPVIMTIHRCREGVIRQALAEIGQLASVDAAHALIPILDEHPEFI